MATEPSLRGRSGLPGHDTAHSAPQSATRSSGARPRRRVGWALSGGFLLLAAACVAEITLSLHPTNALQLNDPVSWIGQALEARFPSSTNQSTETASPTDPPVEQGTEVARHFIPLANTSTDTPPLVTLVTSFYPLGTRSKHSETEYDYWIRNFFPVIKAPMVVFLPQGDIVDKIKAMRGDLPTTIHVMDLWEVPPAKKHRLAFEGEQFQIDTEAYRHFPELYAIWDGKTWMVQKAAQDNDFGSSFFFWVDAGAFRDRAFATFPDSERVKQMYAVNGAQTDNIIVSMTGPPDVPLEEVVCYPERQTILRDWLEGGFFGGSKNALKWWYEEFYRRLDERIANHVFAGKDQTIMNDIVRSNLHRVSIIDSKQFCFNEYFFFQPLLSSPAEAVDISYCADLSMGNWVKTGYSNATCQPSEPS